MRIRSQAEGETHGETIMVRSFRTLYLSFADWVEGNIIPHLVSQVSFFDSSALNVPYSNAENDFCFASAAVWGTEKHNGSLLSLLKLQVS